MARLTVSLEVLADMLFPGARVSVGGVGHIDSLRRTVDLDVHGPDVPEVPVVVCTLSRDVHDGRVIQGVAKFSPR